MTMKTPEEIKRGLMVCSNLEGSCEECPYKPEIKEELACSIGIMKKDALAYIEQLEERIDLMMIQMHGDCGVCKHRNESAFQSPCAECTETKDNDLWEYEGLPEVKER